MSGSHDSRPVNPIRVRKTPGARHPYMATRRGSGTYGWGNTPQEARECLLRQEQKSK